MADGASKASIARTASDLTEDDLSRLSSLLNRKLQNIPERHLPAITIDDIIQPARRALYIATLPPDIQLPYILRNRSSIDRDNERPIKDERKQPLKVTRAIFFYHLNEAYQFQRFHDTSRWNLALFIALLSTPPPSTESFPSLLSNHAARPPTADSQAVPPAARRFMTNYLAAVIERHNAPTVFDKREEFIKKWKDSRFDMFVSFKASQIKLLKKALLRLSPEWERELDIAMQTMGREKYNALVAPFVGSIIPGRKDQGFLSDAHTHFRDFTQPASLLLEAVTVEGEGTNELLEALRVPLEERNYRDDHRLWEEVNTPVDIKVAIAAVRNARPADMLPALMRLFPVWLVERKSRWGCDLPARSDTEKTESR